MGALIRLAFLFMIALAIFALVVGPIVFGSRTRLQDTLAARWRSPQSRIAEAIPQGRRRDDPPGGSGRSGGGNVSSQWAWSRLGPTPDVNATGGTPNRDAGAGAGSSRCTRSCSGWDLQHELVLHLQLQRVRDVRDQANSARVIASLIRSPRSPASAR
jgi:hypothetical protein